MRITLTCIVSTSGCRLSYLTYNGASSQRHSDYSRLGVRIVEWLSHSTVVQEAPGSNPGDAEKCWAVMELFVNIYLYEFVLSLVCVHVRCFSLY